MKAVFGLGPEVITFYSAVEFVERDNVMDLRQDRR